MSKKNSTRKKQSTHSVATPYEIVCDFSEKQIEADVAAYFGYLSAVAKQYGRFRLLDLNEQVFGADKKFIDGCTTYYIQFKKPYGLRPVPAHELGAELRAKASKAQHIRHYRANANLDQSPHSIYFPLRAMAEHAVNFQHNILRSYELPPSSRAFYVCPLVLRESDYVAALRVSSGTAHYPFEYLDLLRVRHGAHVAHVARSVPFLRGHAAIVPHDTVTSSDHHYSFSAQATDIAFHSPTQLAGGPSRLSDFVASQIEHLANPDVEMATVDGLVARLREIASTWAAPADNRTMSREPLEWLQQHGELLRRNQGIRQLVLFRLKAQDADPLTG